MVSQPLQVLLVEDLEGDAMLLSIALEKAGFAPRCHRVETPAALAAALREPKWDLIIADYRLPAFRGLEALEMVKQHGLDVPFIIVSGHIDEDTAVRAMKAGAHDYVMKDNLPRLGPAVQRELREAEMRRQRRQAEDKLKVESAFRKAVENSVPSGIAAVDLEGRQTYVNPAFCQMVGWSEPELVGAKPPFVYWPPEDLDGITEALGQVSPTATPPAGLELRFRRRSGERLQVLLQVTPLKDAFGNVVGWVSSASDITERKRAESRLAAEHAITRLLAKAQSLPAAGPEMLQVLLESLELEAAQIWIPNPQGDKLEFAAANARLPRWADPPPLSEAPASAASPPTPAPARLAAFLEESRGWTFSLGASLPGKVWQERRPVWVADLAREAGWERQQLALQAGLRSALAFPLQTASGFFGVVECFSLRPLEFEPAVLNMVTAIGADIGQFVQRRQAEEALRRAHDELEIRVQHRTAQLKAANAQLEKEIAERERLEHELLEITEKTRRRIGLDLHDDLGQKLSGVALMTKGLVNRLERQGSEAAPDAGRIHDLVQQAMAHASDLANDLAMLDVEAESLPAALESLAAHASDLFQMSCRFNAEGRIPPLDRTVVNQLYKIAQEAVTNAIKHGKSKNVAISLANGSDKLVLTVKNNGLPFPDLKGHAQGMGLRIMNYRANIIGASFEVKCAGSRGGTLVTCAYPLNGHE